MHVSRLKKLGHLQKNISGFREEKNVRTKTDVLACLTYLLHFYFLSMQSHSIAYLAHCSCIRSSESSKSGPALPINEKSFQRHPMNPQATQAPAHRQAGTRTPAQGFSSMVAQIGATPPQHHSPVIPGRPTAPSAPFEGLDTHTTPVVPPSASGLLNRVSIRRVSIRQATGKEPPYCGIGLFFERGKRGCMVSGLEPGGAAAAGGQIEIGDFFNTVAGQDVSTLPTEQIRYSSTLYVHACSCLSIEDSIFSFGCLNTYLLHVCPWLS